MTAENQVLQDLRAVNPITDHDTVDLPDTSPTAFLATLERKPMTVQTNDSSTGRRRIGTPGLALAAVLIALVASVGVIAWLVNDESSPDFGSPLEVVEEFVALRTSGDLSGALELMTEELAAENRQFYEGLEAWNLRGELVRPCEEQSAVQILCVLSERDDFHAAGGVTPFTTHLRLVVNDEGLISNAAINVTDWGTTLQPYNSRFIAWMLDAHPAEAANLTGVPMSQDFNEDDARIALQYVDEFVAQSDSYPIEN